LLLHRFRIGDHRVIITDFNLKDVVGYQVKIYYLEIRRLTEDDKSVVEKCIAKVLEQLTFYNINKKLDELEDNCNSLEELRKVVKLDMIDKQVT
jgi:hypothetical protein